MTEEEKTTAEGFRKLCDQMLLLSEHHSGKSLDNPETERKFISDNIGVFLTIMAAASNSKLDLVELVVTIRHKWLQESISTDSTTR